METGLITMLLGVILTAILAQTTAVWVKFNSLEKRISQNKCPFGECPLYLRARDEAASERRVTEHKLDG